MAACMSTSCALTYLRSPEPEPCRQVRAVEVQPWKRRPPAGAFSKERMSIHSNILAIRMLENEIARCNIDQETLTAVVDLVRANGRAAYFIIQSMIDPCTGCGHGPTFVMNDAEEPVCAGAIGGSCGTPVHPPPVDPTPTPGPDGKPAGPLTPVEPPSEKPVPPAPAPNASSMCDWVRKNLCNQPWFDIVLAVVLIRAPRTSRLYRAAQAMTAACSATQLCDDEFVSWELVMDLTCFATSLLALMRVDELERILATASKDASLAKYLSVFTRGLRFIQTRKDKYVRLVMLIPAAYLILCEIYFMYTNGKGSDVPGSKPALPPAPTSNGFDWESFVDLIPIPGLPPIMPKMPTWPQVSGVPDVPALTTSGVISPREGMLPRYTAAPPWPGATIGAPDPDPAMYARFREANTPAPTFADWPSSLAAVRKLLDTMPADLRARVVDETVLADPPRVAAITTCGLIRSAIAPLALIEPPSAHAESQATRATAVSLNGLTLSPRKGLK